MQAALAVDGGGLAASTREASGAAVATYQAFRIASVWCYTGFDEASELVDPLVATWLPNTPSWFQGLAHLNGFVVPVVDWAAGGSPDDAGHGLHGTPSKPLFHLLFGRQQERVAVAIHTLPFTVSASQARSPQPVDTQTLPPTFSQIVDAVLPWDQLSHTAHAFSASMSGGQQPDALYHLSGSLLADWFSRSLYA